MCYVGSEVTVLSWLGVNVPIFIAFVLFLEAKHREDSVKVSRAQVTLLDDLSLWKMS